MSAPCTLPALPAQDGVEFRHVPGFPGYCVGDDGSVWGCRRSGYGSGTFGEWKRLRLRPSGRDSDAGKGHLAVQLRRDGRSFPRYVHVLVLLAFVGPPPEGCQGCHEDDDKGNNRLTNLRWDTQEGNAADAVRNGVVPSGERHRWASLSDATVAQMKAFFAGGGTYQEAAARFNTTKDTARFIMLGKTWKHIAPAEVEHESVS